MTRVTVPLSTLRHLVAHSACSCHEDRTIAILPDAEPCAHCQAAALIRRADEENPYAIEEE